MDQSISYNPFGLLRKNIPSYLNEVKVPMIREEGRLRGTGLDELRCLDRPRRASLSGQDGHIKVFICTLYVSCIMMNLIQILQNEINESKSAQREKKRTPKQRYDF